MARPRMPKSALILGLVFIVSSAYGQTPAAPFVAGFERFARHGGIDAHAGGTLLLTELSCAACHAADSESLAPKRGPRLNGVGNRLHQDWLRDFLQAPATAKPGTTMPDVLNALPQAEREAAVEALVAFLATRHLPFPEVQASGTNPLPHEFWSQGDADRGRRLYHLVGCVACHEPEADYSGGHSRPSAMAALLSTLEPEEIEEMGLADAARPVPSIPLPNMAAKYSSKALTFFLAAPETIRPSARMPNLKLSFVEAADLAAYLRKASFFSGDTETRKSNALGRDVALADSPLEDAPSEDAPLETRALVEKGRALFTSLLCVNCHDLDGLASPPPAKSLAQLAPSGATGCLGEPAPGLPRFQLDAAQKQALSSALDTLGDRTHDDPLAESPLELSLMRRNCYACHQRGDRGGIPPQREHYFETIAHVDLGDEGRLPPPLDHVGQKLTSAALAKVLEGSGDVRPHMLVRMPKYTAEATNHLPAAFAEADQASSRADAEVFPKRAGLEELGRQLLNNGCVQCHPVRGEAVGGAVGIDLALVTERVRPQWFLEFLRNPAELKARTRMPTFFPNGRSAIPEILEGDMDRQIAAMWSYLKEIKSQKLPDKIEEARSQQFELIPKDRPILIRTFMDVAGTHAIAVGFPQEVHYAFDADQLRLAQAWRGRFLDAYGSWFVRSAPPAAPLGTHIVSLPTGLPFAQLPSPDAPWPTQPQETADYRFLGHRFDPQGIPTFRYRVLGFEIEDRIEPTQDHRLKRMLRITGDAGGDSDKPLWFQVQRGKNLKSNGNTCSEPNGVTVTLGGDHGNAFLWRDPRDSQVMQWRIPVRSGQSVEVKYQW